MSRDYGVAVPASAEPIRIPLPGGHHLDGAIARPEGNGPFPGVLVLHEIFGLNDDMRRIAGRFADNGYVALAPNLYSHGPKAICLTRVLVDHQRGCRGKTIDDIEGARVFLGDQPEVDRDRLAVIGFCLGGGFAVAFGATGRVQAAAVNYGAVPEEQSRLDGVCPVVGSYGGLDKQFLKSADRLEQHLTALGVPHDVKVYPDTGHSFLSYDNVPRWMARLPMPLPTGYREAEAEDAWKRILAFFDEHVRG